MEQQPEINDIAPEEKAQQGHSSVFRPKSIDRISSPEQMNEYIRVASPRMWAVLIAAVTFLVGMLIWAVFGLIASTVGGAAIVREGKCTVYVTLEDAENLCPGDSVTINKQVSTLSSVSFDPFILTDTFPEYAKTLGSFEYGEWICTCDVENINLSDGIYQALITVERTSPFSLLTDTDTDAETD